MGSRTPKQNNLSPRHTASRRLPVRVPEPKLFGSGKRGSAWVRDPAWPSLPAVTASEQKVVGLYAVWPNDDNFITLYFSGAYTVDWGDGGATENVAGATTAYHTYAYSNGSLTDSTVTFTDADDLVTRTAHGYIDGDRVRFYNITSTTGLTAGQFYYVINSTTNTFQVSTTNSGAAITLTNDGSATLLPYKIATVTITPQGGQNLTTCTLHKKHNQIGLPGTYVSGWLDLTISMPNCSSSGLTISSSSEVAHRNLAQCTIVTCGGLTTAANMFYNCSSLQSVPLFNTASITNMSNMFNGCTSLQSVPLFNTANVTNYMTYMFASCNSLQSVPLFDTSKVTAMSFMFNGCTSLQSVPLFNTASVTDMSNMFNGCTSLQSVPLFNTSINTSMSDMFKGCTAIQSIPLFNTANVQSFYETFYGCTSLQSIPLLNLSSATSTYRMFWGCSSLQSVPGFNVSAANASTSSMFQGCVALQSVPLFNTAGATDVSIMFSGCNALESVPAFDFSAATTIGGNIFATCYSLSNIAATGFKISFTANGKLSKTALQTLFGGLAKPSSTQTLTCSTNYGYDTPVSKSSCGTTTGSAVVTCSNTSSLSTGMLVTGTGINDAVAVTFQDAGDTVTRTAHGLANGTIVSFASITSTTGIATYTPYYVVNQTTDTFQVSTTLGGPALALTTDGSGTMLYGSFIQSINTNVSFTLSAPASATGTITATCRLLNTSIATLKNWAVN